MSRSQDLVSLLRGLQIVLEATVKSQEQCVQRLWANSSIRDIVNENRLISSQCLNKFLQNPSKELSEVSNSLKEAAERSSVVLEGIRQYTASSVKFEPKEITKDLGNIDVASLTLKELEHYLAQNKSRSPEMYGTLRQEELGTPLAPTSVAEDEKYVKEWVNFIAKEDDKVKDIIPEVKKPPEEAKTLTNIPQLSAVAKQRKVPATRIGRIMSFGGLFAGVGLGTIGELTKGALGFGGTTNVKEAVFNQSNADRIVDTLCRVRGAALKIGQILSIQVRFLVFRRIPE